MPLLFTAVLGCSPANDDVMSSPVVFSYVGGSYTEARLDADVKLRGFMFRETIRNRNGNLANIEESISQMKMAWRDDAIMKGVLATAVRLQADREGFRPSEDQRAAVETRYVTSIGNKKIDFLSLQRRATEAGVRAAFDNQFEHDVVLSAMGKAIVQGDTGFSETNVWIFLANASNDLRRSEAKNVELYRLATNVAKRLRAGEDFNRVYDECCNLEPDAKAENRDVAEYDESDFSGEDCKDAWGALKALPDGGVSEVLETDEGLVIYKVFAHIERSEQTEQFALKLGKVVIRRVIIREIPKPEEARKDVKAWFARDALERKMKAAVMAAQIDFGPAATNLSTRLRHQLTEMGIMKQKEKEETSDASE